MVLTSRICVCLIAVLVQLLQGVQCYFDYDYLIFENFDLVKEIHEAELKTHEDLKKLRDGLRARQQVLQDFKEGIPDIQDVEEYSAHPINVMDGLLEIGRRFNKHKRYLYQNLTDTDIQSDIMSRTASYPSLKELNAAARGLLFLHETYELDWKDTIKGEIAAASLPSGSFNFTSVEKINPIDLPIFAELAFGLNSFDTCIQILRIAWDYIDKYPEDLRNQLEDLKRKVVEMNNQYLVKRDTVIGNKHRTLPYLVGKNLKKKKNQGKKTAKHMVTNLQSPEAQNFFLQTVCRGEGLLNKNMNNQKNLPKCKWLHHFDPYLKLGPIKLEIAKRSPWTVVFHDLLSEKEMNFLIEYSKPRLSRNREVDASNSPGDRADILSGKSRRIVAKTVQCWLNDIVYDHGKDSVFLAEDVHNYVHKDVDDNFNYTVVHPIMYKLSKKIEIATQMNATGKWSATSYQTTNYGLGGLCESHIDPHGHLEGAALPDSRKNLLISGDMLGTFMAWLSDCDAGGATAFLDPGSEVTVFPTKGSAAFWISMDKKGYRDMRTSHAGCPVLKGSKWILNKWLYMYDQVKKYPCGLNPGEYFEGFSGFY